MSFFRILSLFLLLGFISCEKKKNDLVQKEPELISTELQNGFPQDRNAINGYLVATVVNYNSSYYSLSSYAVFNDPAKNLMETYEHLNNLPQSNGESIGNINVGSVKVSGNYNLTTNSNFGSNSIFYSLNNSSSSSFNNFSPTWSVSGNKSFKPFNLFVTRSFPVIPNTTGNYTLSISNGFTLNLQTLASNYDSLIVRIGYSFNNPCIRRVGTGVSSITFNSSELANLNTSSTTISIFAFNYSHKTIENKIYVYELGAKQDNNIYLYP